MVDPKNMYKSHRKCFWMCIKVCKMHGGDLKTVLRPEGIFASSLSLPSDQKGDGIPSENSAQCPKLGLGFEFILQGLPL